MIVFYNPRSTASGNPPLPMSLLSVASSLPAGTRWHIVDGNIEQDPVRIIVELAAAEPLTAIGVTVMHGPQLQRAVADSRHLAAALPNVPIVWGGYFPSQHAETVLRDPAIQCCVRGQGEHTFSALVTALETDSSFESIDGLSYRQNGTVHHAPNRPLEPLDSLPRWNYQSLQMERYIHSHYLGDRVGAHHSSFGCPFACSFCAVVDIVERKWVAESPQRVAEIVALQHRRYGIDAIQFHDMDFFISESRAVEIAERIAPLGLRWWALGRVDELMRYSDASWHQLAASGLKMVFCGAETGSDDVLARMNKGGKSSVEATYELAKRTREHGIVPEFSFVLGNPPDPMADIEQTIGFIRRLKLVNPALEVILYMYTPVPSEGYLFDEARALGFRFPDTLDDWVSGDWTKFSLRRDPQNPWLEPSLKRRVREFEQVLNAYFTTVTDTSIKGLKRFVLRALGGWRYYSQIYSYPWELAAFHRLFRYRRPETAGF